MSSQSVGERVRRLEDEGVIEGYHAAISAKKLGYAVNAIILARPIGPDERFAEMVAKLPEILECHRVTGDVNFVTRAVATDIEDLERILEHFEPICSYVLTMVVLSTTFSRSVPVSVGEN